MENTLYFRPKNGSLQKLRRYEKYNRVVFREINEASEKAEESFIDTLKPKNLTGKVIKLFDQCIEFLSNFTHCFDSLIDFPEDFAVAIWKLAVPKLTQDSANTSKSLRTYSEAYPTSFLPKIRVTSLLLVNNYELCLPSLLTNTKQLDLTGCQLDDSHDLLGHLVLLTALELLCLASNHLTDKGLARLLLPWASGAKVRYLDVSDNRLNPRALMRLAKVGSIQEVVLGEGDFSQGDLSKGLGPLFKRKACPRLQGVETDGFARDLLDLWLGLSQKSAEVKHKPNDSFYTSKVIAQPSDESCRPNKNNKVMFERILSKQVKVDNNSVTLARKPTMKVTNPVKRKAGDDDGGGINKKVIDREQKVSDFEQNLLSIYN